MSDALWRLASDDRLDRIRAIRALPVVPGSHVLAHALRRVLFADGDAVARAAAARRLGALADAPDAAAWLLEAIGDAAPLVRDAVLGGLARCGGAPAMAAVRRAARHDRVWWVRRSALYALGAIAAGGLRDDAGAGADGAIAGGLGAVTEGAPTAGGPRDDALAHVVAVLDDALHDPFWRVRHAAVKVLAVLGARDAAVRDRVRARPASDAQAFLRASWGPIALEAPARAAAASALPAALRDPDPAVVTARLAADRAADPVALVELLCDPHVALRVLAAERIAASRSPAAYRAALDWLEQPRVPYVADTVERLLDGLGDPAAALASHALASRDRPGAARWAIGWVVATGDDALREPALARARSDASLRRAALPLVEVDELVRWARDAAARRAGADDLAEIDDVADADALLDAIAAVLHARGAADALLALPGERPRVRALQLDVRGRRGEREAIAAAAVADPHHGPRAIAARWWAQLDRAAAAASGRDPDPAVREASLSAATAAALLDDADPFVARAAIEQLAASARRLDDAQRAAGRARLDAADPWIRAQACRLPLVPSSLPAMLARLGDPDAGVRAAAHDALARGLADGASLDAAVAALAADVAQPARLRALAEAWQVRALDDAALARLVDFADISPGTPAPVVATAAPVAAPPVAARAIPRAGLAIAPLVLSGAFDLSPAAMAAATEAGVDTWFWEPGYDRLTAHLRAVPRARGQVVTGSYHADAASIEADVDRALRRLRRDALDVFLLFWSRSPARVDAAAYEVLARLKRAGKIRAAGFSTHDRGLARAAIEASPWDVVMIRHSAAHPGIEAELLPAARATGTAILTFSALCYGRMVSGPGAPSPADCYRYSLSQPGVVGCISAPRRRREVVENLAALRAPMLGADQLAALRAHGVGVRAENQRFNTLLRQPTRDAAAAARALLLAELAHETAPEAAPAGELDAAARGAR